MIRRWVYCFWELALLLLVLNATSFGQGENNHWRFGCRLGFDFNLGSPAVVPSNLESQEGCAAASDASGNLLFYSNGNKIWNAAGSVMPNGSGLLGNGMGFYSTGSSMQGVAIVKSISNPDQYFLFVLDSDTEIGMASNGYLRYSMVDMSLNSGLGDIVPGQKNMIIDSFMSESMVIAKGEACNYWLITHRYTSAEYHVFRIGIDGLDPAPVISTGLSNGMIISELKLSPDEKMLSFAGNGYENVELAGFSTATGMVSGVQHLAPLPLAAGGYGTEFSPDNKKLYLSEGLRLLQYDLSAWPNVTAIQATQVVVEPQMKEALSFCMRRGPDNKIYLAKANYGPNPGSPSIARINNPNATGSACNFDSVAILIPITQTFFTPGTTMPGGLYGFGFGNSMVILPDQQQTIAGPGKDTIVCAGNEVTLSGRPGSNAYLWNDGSTNAAATFSEDGLYWVASIKSCVTYIDTFKVRLYRLNTLGFDTFICKGGSLLLDVTGPAGSTYLWQDGSTTPTLNVSEKGLYSVIITRGTCTVKDSIRVGEIDPYVKIGGNDSVFCEGGSVWLYVTAYPPGSYVWNTGHTGDTIKADKTGVYKVTVHNVCGTLTATIPVEEEDCDCPVFVPNAFTPNQDGRNDRFEVKVRCQTAVFRLSVFNRFGERVYFSDDALSGWDGRYKGVSADVGTYFYELHYTGLRSGKQGSRKGDLTLLR